MGAVVAETSEFPLFELYGPPCRAEDCSGVLVPHVTVKPGATSECFQKCSVCGSEFDRIPTAKMLSDFERTVERLLKGGKGPPDAS
jgi:hypothetical protein